MNLYFPPKPTLITVDQKLFKELELRTDVVAELKFNGSRLVLYHHPVIDLTKLDMIKGVGLHYEFFNRDGERMSYSPSKEVIDQLDKLNLEGECVLDGELVHTHIKNIRHNIVIFDVIVKNKYLKSQDSFEKRRNFLEESFGWSINTDHFDLSKFKFSNNIVWLSPQWKGGVAGLFREIYNQAIKIDGIEGLVIKSLKAQMELGAKSSPTVRTSWKVRKPGPYGGY